MRKALALVIFCSLLASFAGSVHALGFGRIGGSTTLGQPLNFSAIVRLDSDELLGNECVSAEVFSGENKLAAGAVRTSIEPGSSASDRLVRVTTSTLLDEPVVTVNLSVGCNARLSRKFVVFLDPPFINLAQSAAPEPPVEPARVQVVPAEPASAASASESGGQTAPAPAVTVARAAPKPRPRPKALTVNPKPAAAPVPRARKPAPADTDVALARPAPTGPRLKLEAPTPEPGPRASAAPPPNAPAPMVATASAPVQPASAPAAEPPNDLVAKERERLRLLEENLTRLRQETDATQKTLAALQSRLRGAEQERFANPIVYALGGLCLLLIFAVAAMWRRYRLREAAWWSSAADDGGAAVAAARGVVAQVSNDGAAAARMPAPAPAPAPVANVKVGRQGTAAVAPAAAVEETAGRASVSPDTMPAPSVSEQGAVVARRELSVEELIDLEQQAEFFVVLGQDEAAIDLLMGHLRSTGGSSPLPYLKLLEIYRRRGDREAYVRTRERFNRRFNAYAPDWDSDPKDGRYLEDYPEMIERLQLLWTKPAQVIEVLDAALFRRDQTEDTFDVPAYRELVLLYSVVRDIAEHDGSSAAVDLLLPIEDAPADNFGAVDVPLNEPLPLVSVTELSSADRRATALDLDISAVRVFERPVDLEPPSTTLGSGYISLVDEPEIPGRPPRKP